MSAPVTISSTAASRIGQLVRLLGSDRNGEIVAAATALQRTLRNAGADLHYLADVAERALQQPAIPPPPAPDDDQDDEDVADLVRFCALSENYAQLTDRERGFVGNMHALLRRQGGAFAPSEKQANWLHHIADRLREQP
jgi:hypothetical protein